MLHFSVSSVETFFFYTAVFWLLLLLGSACSSGGRMAPLQGIHPAAVSLLPSQLCRASVFILNFSPHGCQKVCGGLYFKPSRSPGPCWGLVRQRLGKLETREALCPFSDTDCPVHFILPTVAYLYRKQRVHATEHREELLLVPSDQMRNCIILH